MIFPKRLSGQKPFSYPFYLFAVLTVLIGILLINGYFEIQRTRSQLFNILENEALVVIQGLEQNSGNLIAGLSQEHPPLSTVGIVEGSEDSLSIEDQLIERLINLALQMDQEAVQKKDDPQFLKDRIGRSGLTQIFFLKTDVDKDIWKTLPIALKTEPPFFQKVLNGKTRLAVFRGEGPLRKTLPLAVAVARRLGQGMILMALSFSEYVSWSRQIIIQNLLEDFSGKGNITYLRVEDPKGMVIAQIGERFFMGLPKNQARRDVHSGQSNLFWITGKEGDFLEILRPFSPGGKELGVVRLGLSLKEVNPIVDQNQKNIILMSMVLFGLGMISLFFIFRLQNRHLQKMKEMENQIRLKEELSAMGQLASGVAHEIKNPLNAISLVIQRLEKEFVWDKPEEQKEYDRFTGIVRNEIDRVNRIIGQFLLMSKPLDTKMEERPIIEILEYCLEVMEEEFRQKRIRVIKGWEGKGPIIRCDRFQLTQAFINIFNNALEAMPDGGSLHLTVKQFRSSEVGVQSEKKPLAKLTTQHSELSRDFVEISIADTGKGISSEGMGKIFAPYYTTKEKGLGLGLAITQKMIQAHEGTLEVQSIENKGATIIIRLPLSPSE
ncbi:MAG: ATP-binding protein [Thermodesulfobacteriota bacterium]|jgi:signal transduction histidine kinase